MDVNSLLGQIAEVNRAVLRNEVKQSEKCHSGEECDGDCLCERCAMDGDERANLAYDAFKEEQI